MHLSTALGPAASGWAPPPAPPGTPALVDSHWSVDRVQPFLPPGVDPHPRPESHSVSSSPCDQCSTRSVLHRGARAWWPWWQRNKGARQDTVTPVAARYDTLQRGLHRQHERRFQQEGELGHLRGGLAHGGFGGRFEGDDEWQIQLVLVRQV